MSTDLMMPTNHLILCYTLLLLPSIFPSIRDLSSESAFCIRWPKDWSLSFSISPASEYSRLISFRMAWVDLVHSKGLSRVFPSTTVWGHQFIYTQPSVHLHSAINSSTLSHQFIYTQPSICFNSHIHTWLLEKPQLGLHSPLSAKWCLCFLIHCLGLSAVNAGNL